MKIKGTAVKSTQDFIKEKYPDKYQDWLKALPPDKKEVFEYGIFLSNWYDLIDAVLIPTRIAGEVIFSGDIKKAAFEIGRFSALEALKGIYKIFVKVASVDFVIKKSKSIFTTYYSSGNFELTFESAKKYVFEVTGFVEGEELIFERIAGWIEGVFEVISSKNFKVTYTIEKKSNNNILAKITAKSDE